MKIYEMPRGDDYPILYTVVDGTGATVDLTGCTIWWTAKTATTVADPGTFQKKTGGSGITLATQSGSTLGQFTVEIAAANTSSLGDGVVDLVFDCQIKDTSNKIYTIETGILRVNADVTISTS
jgi:hypothetical protein